MIGEFPAEIKRFTSQRSESENNEPW